MMLSIRVFLFTLCISLSSFALSHKTHSKLQYIGNEGVLVLGNEKRILFDPFFHNNYGTYTLVPQEIRKKIFSGLPPFEKIDALFISHAHGDHFSDVDIIAYLKAQKHTQLFAPQQAIEKVLALPQGAAFRGRMTPISLNYGDKPKKIKFGDLVIEAVRIPHAGWPGRANIENIIFRVSLKDGTTVIHMGDADPNDKHFLPLKNFWDNTISDIALPPYWFFLSAEGNMILSKRINANKSVGIHVPTKVPNELKATSFDYFSKPNETRKFEKSHSH